MRIRAGFIISVFCLSACQIALAANQDAKNSGNERVTMGKESSLVGTWKVISYRTWSSDGQVSEPFGSAPVGMAVFDAAGNVSIQLSRSANHEGEPSETERIDVSASYGGFFGTYTVDATDSHLTMKVIGSNLPSYLGSTQERSFSVQGNTLTIGQPGKYQAIAVRISVALPVSSRSTSAPSQSFVVAANQFLSEEIPQMDVAVKAKDRSYFVPALERVKRFVAEKGPKMETSAPCAEAVSDFLIAGLCRISPAGTICEPTTFIPRFDANLAQCRQAAKQK